MRAPSPECARSKTYLNGGGEVTEIPPPHSPVMRALGFEERVLDARLLERLMQGSGFLERRILLVHAIQSRSINLLVFAALAASVATGSESRPPAIPALMIPTD